MSQIIVPVDPNINPYSSDLYFCANCNQGWKDNKWMECCKGCVGHRDMGWTIADMKACYGMAMDSMIKMNMNPNYYFPLVKRELPPRRLRFDPARCLFDKYILQPFVKYDLDWRLQQADLLKKYKDYPNSLTWNALDPEVQHRVLYKPSRFRY